MRQVDNALLLQLSNLFGPMLVSALQIVDRGEGMTRLVSPISNSFA